MTKLLMVTTISATLQAFLLPYAKYFRSQGWIVDALSRDTQKNKECVNAFDHVYDVSWSRNPLDLRNFINTPEKIRQIVQQGNYDIVHVHTPVAAFVTRFALRKLRSAKKVKVIYTAHGFHFYTGGSKIKNSLFIALEKIAGRWTDHLIVINQEDYEAALKYKIAAEKHLTKMPGIGLDLSQYDASRVSQKQVADLRKDLKLKENDQYVLMIAEFNPGKRHHDAIEALSLVQDSHIHLVFAGTGLLFEDMKLFAESKGLADRCHFLGLRNDVPVLLKGAAALLHPSEREGLPRSIMESMAMGTPVIGTNIRGTRDLLSDECGMLIPLGDIEEIAKKMKVSAFSSLKSYKIVHNALNRIKNYNITILIKKHLHIYKKEINKK